MTHPRLASLVPLKGAMPAARLSRFRGILDADTRLRGVLL